MIDREDDRYARRGPSEGDLAAAIGKLRGRLAARNRIQAAGLPLLALMLATFVLSFGAANAAGTLVGGRVADADARRTLVIAHAVLVMALGGLLVFGSSPIAAALALAAWGLVGFGCDAGIAVGAIVGGWALASGASYLILLGLGVCAAALPASWATGRLTTPTSGPDRGRAR